MDSCSLCHGNSGWHARARKQLVANAERELKAAEGELNSLKLLFRELLWFNFEVTSQTWNEPWSGGTRTKHNKYSQICLHAYRLTEHSYKGRVTYSAQHPIYWIGWATDAPILPPHLLYQDIIEAKAYVDYLRERLYDAELYAPGGSAYEKLRTETQVGRNSNENGAKHGTI